MSKRTQAITVDLYEKSYNEEILKQFDTTQIVFTVLQKNAEFNLDSITPEIWFVKPNGTVVQQSAMIIDNKVVVELNIDCVRIAGRGKMEVVLMQNDETISSFQIDVKIEKSGKENAKSDNTPSYYENLDKIGKEAKANGDYAKKEGDYAKEKSQEYGNAVAAAQFSVFVVNENMELELHRTTDLGTIEFNLNENMELEVRINE